MNNSIQIDLQQTEQLIDQLWQPHVQKGEPIVYAILDGARNKKIHPMLAASKMKLSCLYDGKLNYDLTLAAPYLVRLEKDADFTRDLIQQAWGNSWGIFAITYKPATLIGVRRNCKKVAFVRNEETKRKLLFRYYDPHVLRTYLPQCSPEEALKFFGPVTEFLVEAEYEESNLSDFHRYCQTETGVVDLNVTIAESTQITVNPRQEIKGLLTISSLQMSEFEKVKLVAFFKQMRKTLNANFFDDFIEKGNEQQQLKWVEENGLTAISLGFRNEAEICRYLNVAILQGDDFIDEAWAKEILASHYQATTKAMQLEAASIEQLKLQKEVIQDEIDLNKEALLSVFYETHKLKTKQIGEGLFNLSFAHDAELKDWLYRVGKQCISHELYDDIEMDLWLDLSLHHGEHFSQQHWAKSILEKTLAAEQKLEQLLENEPASPMSNADLTLIVTRN
ncbi:hypothetical protein MNBD_GAMMA07-1401 [hydrothermal vent metagenome]|uniref:DUF4123 domain-containing protein n=1 Tax=hydrothermal vent metagenome TaxID=652676 RepID=A0A3B0XHZ3_9ZZZZ